MKVSRITTLQDFSLCSVIGLLLVGIYGCRPLTDVMTGIGTGLEGTPPHPAASTPSFPVQSPHPPMKILLVDIANKTGVKASPPLKKRFTDVSESAQNPIGVSIKDRLIAALQRLPSVVVDERSHHASLKDALHRGRSASVTVNPIHELENTEGVDCLISGAVNRYMLSRQSAMAGVKNDPLLGHFEANISIPWFNAFTSAASRSRLPTQDQLAISLQFLDVSTFNKREATMISCAAQETDGTLMQGAVSSCVDDAAKWLVERCLPDRQRPTYVMESPEPRDGPRKPRTLKRLCRKGKGKCGAKFPQSSPSFPDWSS